MIAPSTAPEDIFDRVVHEEKYYGRLNFDDVEPDLRGLLIDFRNHLGSAFVSQRECLWVGTEHPNLYFDYIDEKAVLQMLCLWQVSSCQHR